MISIHAAQEGCDITRSTFNATMAIFQSTQPKRAATFDVWVIFQEEAISIHAAQEGCDTFKDLLSKKF